MAEHCFIYKGERIPVTVSTGFAVVDATVLAEYDQLKHASAAALAEAKGAGRNRSVVQSLEVPVELGQAEAAQLGHAEASLELGQA